MSQFTITQCDFCGTVTDRDPGARVSFWETDAAVQDDLCLDACERCAGRIKRTFHLLTQRSDESPVDKASILVEVPESKSPTFSTDSPFGI
jgi:hypothetical protein